MHENEPEFYRKSIWAIRLIFTLEATLISRIVAFGILREKVPGRVISQNGDYNWPPRSCDLRPLDFFLWGYVEDKVCDVAPQSIEELKGKIRAIVDEIEPQMCENVIENFIK